MPSFCFLCAVGRPHAYSKAKGVFLSPSSPKALLNHALDAWFSGIQKARNPWITGLFGGDEWARTIDLMRVKHAL